MCLATEMLEEDQVDQIVSRFNKRHATAINQLDLPGLVCFEMVSF